MWIVVRGRDRRALEARDVRGPMIAAHAVRTVIAVCPQRIINVETQQPGEPTQQRETAAAEPSPQQSEIPLGEPVRKRIHFLIRPYTLRGWRMLSQ